MPTAREIADTILDTPITTRGLPENYDTTLRAELSWLVANFKINIPSDVWHYRVMRAGLPDSDERHDKDIAMQDVIAWFDASIRAVVEASAGNRETVLAALARAQKELADATDPVHAEPGTVAAAPLAADIHIVAAGETLRQIADSAGTTVAAICAANPGLDPNGLVAGQRITIPTSTSTSQEAPNE